MISQKIIDILEDNDINIVTTGIQDGEHYTELEFYSNAGEDFVMDIWHDNTDAGFIQAFIEYAYDFDPDEHAEMWAGCRGRVSGVPDSIRELIDDADGISEFLYRIADKLSERS